MSNQASQKVRRQQSPSTMQRPMKAIHQFSLKQGSPTRNNRKNSPSSSPTPTWGPEGPRTKTRRSPDNRSSPERRSPSSPSQHKVERPKAVRLSPGAPPQIRRTGSLDTIAGPYLTGQWPRDPRELNIAYTATDESLEKSTQTPEEWDEDRKNKKGHKRSASLGNGDKQEISKIKQHLAAQRTKEGTKQSSSRSLRQSPVHANHSAIAIQTAASQTRQNSSQPITISVPHIPKVPRIRGSVEGLNQEVEKLSLYKPSGTENDEEDRTQEPTPDGHRAPVLELISTTRDIDTQTPLEEASRNSSSTGSRSHSVSPSYMPIIPGTMDTSRPSSRELEVAQKDELDSVSPEPSSMPKFAASPRPNKSYSFVREPPDGCERVKTIDESRIPVMPKPQLFYCPVKSQEHEFRPSERSAFCYLPNKYSLKQELAIDSPATQSSPTTIESQ